MRILFAGGGSGGHFYPIIAVAEAIKDIAREEKLLPPELLFAAPAPYDAKELMELDIRFVPIAAGKLRVYSSARNFFDLFKTGWGVVTAVVKLLMLFPDVVFCKGGYGSFPVVAAARVLGIPVVVHDSDTVPGRVSLFASKFAKKIAISYPEARSRFKVPDDKIALTGVPIRKQIMNPAAEGGREYLKLEPNVPVILVLTGSQGAEAINSVILDALPQLVEKYYVIHQTGKANIGEVKRIAEVILRENPKEDRYRPFGYLNTLALRMAAGAADIVISRAGSTNIFEIASWGKPSLIIPIPEDVSRDQYSNAFAYARSGSAVVVEQANFGAGILMSEIERILGDRAVYDSMVKGTESFRTPDAARTIAREILEIALEHEK